MVGVENNNKPSSGGRRRQCKEWREIQKSHSWDAIMGENEEINAYSETSGISSTCQVSRSSLR